MALVINNPASPYAPAYFVIRNLAYDKSAGVTQVNVGAWFTAARRGDPGSALPPADGAAICALPGCHDDASAYAAILAMSAEERQEAGLGALVGAVGDE